MQQHRHDELAQVTTVKATGLQVHCKFRDNIVNEMHNKSVAIDLLVN